MRSGKISKAALKRMHFVHCALPDIALNSIDTHINLKGIGLDVPVLVMAKSESDAERIERELGMGAIILSKGGARLFKGKRSVQLNDHIPCNVDDGLEAAKAMRAEKKAVPYIAGTAVHRRDEILKQLMIAMFLTNSKNIAKLRKAPIYYG